MSKAILSDLCGQGLLVMHLEHLLANRRIERHQRGLLALLANILGRGDSPDRVNQSRQNHQTPEDEFDKAAPVGVLDGLADRAAAAANHLLGHRYLLVCGWVKVVVTAILRQVAVMGQVDRCGVMGVLR